MLNSIIFLIIGILLGAALWAMSRSLVFKEKMEKAQKELSNAKDDAAKVVKEAEIKAQEIILEGKKETENSKNELLKEFKERERRLNKREEQISQRDELNIVKEKELKAIEKKQKDDEVFLDNQRVQLEEKLTEVNTELERIAGMTQEEAKEVLIQKIEDEAKHDAAKRSRLSKKLWSKTQKRRARRSFQLRYSAMRANMSLKTPSRPSAFRMTK